MCAWRRYVIESMLLVGASAFEGIDLMIDMVPLMWLHMGFRRRDSWICSVLVLLPWETGPGKWRE
jgi:hypothetical protein